MGKMIIPHRYHRHRETGLASAADAIGRSGWTVWSSPRLGVPGDLDPGNLSLTLLVLPMLRRHREYSGSVDPGAISAYLRRSATVDYPADQHSLRPIFSGARRQIIRGQLLPLSGLDLPVDFQYERMTSRPSTFTFSSLRKHLDHDLRR